MGSVELIVLLAFFVGIVVLIGGYFRGWNWVGVNERRYKKGDNEEIQPRKTLWDWMQLLIIPAVLVAGAFLLDQQQSIREQVQADQRAQTDRHIAEDRARDAALGTYLDRMSELILDKNLTASKPGAAVRTVARSQTLTTLDRLADDAIRKGVISRFLYESELSTGRPAAVSLEGADLSGADLSGDTLGGANLRGANLREANLVLAYLSGADLTGANLSGANLNDAKLCRAADETGTQTCKEAKGQGVNLVSADLTRADLTGADLTGADLTGANLTGARVTDEQLAKAELLEGATMPDGSKHD